MPRKLVRLCRGRDNFLIIESLLIFSLILHIIRTYREVQKCCSLPSMRLINGWDKNVLYKAPLLWRSLVLQGGYKMYSGKFCFISDQYYEDFQDKYLMQNKEVITGAMYDRPCFFAFQDNKIPEIFWLVPISSNYEKYKKLFDKKVLRYGKCNTIRFGEVLGRQAAFLIQNMCPVTERYIREVYVDKNGTPIQIDGRTVDDVITNAREVLAIAKRGAQIVFPDIKAIHAALCNQLAK